MGLIFNLQDIYRVHSVLRNTLKCSYIFEFIRNSLVLQYLKSPVERVLITELARDCLIMRSVRHV